jgi:hypothetical protein
MTSRQIRILVLPVVMLCFPVVANNTVRNDTGSESANSRPLVQIFLDPVQGQIRGPNPGRGDALTDYWELGTITGWVYWLELPAVLSGTATDSSIGFGDGGSNGERPPASVGSNNYSFDYYHALKNGILELDKNANWELAHLDESVRMGTMKKIAGRIFVQSNIAHVIFLESAYFVSPGLDQVRAIVDINVFSRPEDEYPQQGVMARTESTYTRAYEFLSQSRGNILRPFHDGEKEALIDSIESDFDRKVERYPNNQAAYEKDRNRALKLLKNREVILPNVAVSEGWSGRSFPTALQLATDSIMQMMRDDLHDIPSSKAKHVEYVSFGGLSRKGKPKKFKGYIVGQQGPNTIYRDKRGNMYSVP